MRAVSIFLVVIIALFGALEATPQFGGNGGGYPSAGGFPGGSNGYRGRFPGGNRGGGSSSASASASASASGGGYNGFYGR